MSIHWQSMSCLYRSQQPTVMPCSPKLAHSYRLATSVGGNRAVCPRAPPVPLLGPARRRDGAGAGQPRGGDAGRGQGRCRVTPTFLTLGVLEAEAGLVSLRHPGAVGGQDVVVGEDVHAVVVPARGSPCVGELGMLGGGDRGADSPAPRWPPPPAWPHAAGEDPHNPCTEATVLRGQAELGPAPGGDTAVPMQAGGSAAGWQQGPQPQHC